MEASATMSAVPDKSMRAHAEPAPSDQQIADLLRSAHTIAVVGLSSNRSRASNGVSRYLQSAGYRIIPVNPNESSVLGEKAYARLEDVPEKVDIVDVFRRSEFVPEVADAAIRIGARAVWMQEGVAHAEAAERARRSGLLVVMDSCILKEHQRLLS
jgi:predicted CoA-binding protein